MNRTDMKKKVVSVAESSLYHKGYASPLDILFGLGWLDLAKDADWREGRVTYLERVVDASLSKISFAMKIFRAWAREKGLRPSQTAYMRKTKGPLRFSKSGSPGIEANYKTHYLPPKKSYPD